MIQAPQIKTRPRLWFWFRQKLQAAYLHPSREEGAGEILEYYLLDLYM